MSAFDGIDPIQEKAIRKALEKEIRADLEGELTANIRRKVETDVRQEARQEVLREVAERTPTDEERETFCAYVNEVRLDAYAQATMASEIADEAEDAHQSSQRLTQPALMIAFVFLPVVMVWARQRLGGFYSPMFIGTAITCALALITVWIASMSKHFRLERRQREHRKIASDFLIIAERAKAFAMVHAERLTTSAELGEVLENLRRDKEKQDRSFHPSAAALENARALVGPRIATEDRHRIAVDLDAEEDELDEPLRARTR